MGESIGQIRQKFSCAAPEELQRLVSEYAPDERSGVKSLVAGAYKKIEALRAEKERIEALKAYERQYGDSYSCICGIDEVGRGPLAGPVVAGAVILPADCDILYIDDSKKLSPQKREQLYQTIREKAVACGAGFAMPDRIDEINILQATYEAMREAIGKLSVAPDLLLNDAVRIPGVQIPQVPIVHGDAKSISIGAGSIYAKVIRDRLMEEYDKIYPQYGFAQNKGYGSAGHLAALKKYGPCPIHRRTFIGKFLQGEQRGE